MNNYRLRLMIGTAITSMALTIVALQLAGLLNPAKAIILMASSSPQGATLSPLRVDCNQPIARLQRSDAGPATLVLTDSEQRLVSCLPSPNTETKAGQ